MSIACFKCGTLNQVPEESSRFQCANCRELNAVPTAGEGALQRGHTRTRTGRTNGLAIASLILSLVGAGLLGLIFGYVAKGQIKQTGDDGDGLATAGIIIGWLDVIGLIIVIIAIANRSNSIPPY